MIKQGSTVMRQDQSEDSAIKIIQHIFRKRDRVVLSMKEEMASGKTLDDTSAGRELEAELERMRQQHKAEMQGLREELAEARKQNDRRSRKEMKAIRAELQKNLDRSRQDLEGLRVTMGELQKQRKEELREERRKYSKRDEMSEEP